MSFTVNIEHEWVNSENLSLPVIHLLIPGRQLCEQAQNYLHTWKFSGYLPEPTLGSLLLALILRQYSHSHQFLISYIEPSIPLAEINLYYRELLPELNKEYISLIKTHDIVLAFTICSHFLPVQLIIKSIKKIRDQRAGSKPLIVELQHGWVVGKQSALRASATTQTNPDIYFTIDKKSKDYLAQRYQNVNIHLIGDVLFATQLLNELRTHSIDSISDSLNNKSLNLLVCFSARDVELGYTSNEFVYIGKHPFPRELVTLVSYLKLNTDKVNIRLRAKPHQNQAKLPKGFPIITHQNSLASDVLWSDFVCSALSTVSVSSSLLGIPSCFYISRWASSHNTLLKFYSQSISHITNNVDLKSLSFMIWNNDWTKVKADRPKLCLNYSRFIQNKFYSVTDQILKNIDLNC